MKKYKVIGRYVKFMSGVLELSKEQYGAREHALTPVEGKEDLYQVLKPTGFKKGEEFGYDGKVNKALLKDLSIDREEEEEVPGENAELLSILDKNLDDLTAGIEDFSLEDLHILKDAEEAGKTRKGAMEAIDNKIAEHKYNEMMELLGKKETEIVTALPDFSDDDLLELRGIEEEEGARENILKSIDEEIENRK